MVTIAQEAGWAQGPAWTGVENLAAPQGFHPRAVQPVASRYTNYANRPTSLYIPTKNKIFVVKISPSNKARAWTIAQNKGDCFLPHPIQLIPQT